MILLLGAVIIHAAFWVGFQFHSAAWVHLLLWPTVTIPLAVLLMRPLKAALIAQHNWDRTAEMAL